MLNHKLKQYMVECIIGEMLNYELNQYGGLNQIRYFNLELRYRYVNNKL